MKIPEETVTQATDFNKPFAMQLIKQVENAIFARVGQEYGLSVDCRGRHGAASMRITVDLAIPAKVMAKIHPPTTDSAMLWALRATKGTKIQFLYKGKWLDGLIERKAGKRYLVSQTVPAGKPAKMFRCSPNPSMFRLGK